MNTLPPAGRTSPTLATRYSIGPDLRRGQLVIRDLNREIFDLVFCRIERVLRRLDRVLIPLQIGNRAIEQLHPLVERLLRHETP